MSKADIIQAISELRQLNQTTISWEIRAKIATKIERLLDLLI